MIHGEKRLLREEGCSKYIEFGMTENDPEHALE
jgi:riboflavin synthase